MVPIAMNAVPNIRNTGFEKTPPKTCGEENGAVAFLVDTESNTAGPQSMG